MTYRRVDAPREFFSGKELSARLSGIGVRFAVDPVRDPNIEDVLLSAANEAIFGGDSRLWGLLFEWWHAHHPYVNAERLVRVLREVGRPKLTAFFSGLAQTIHPCGRFRTLAAMYRGKRLVMVHERYRYRLTRDGEVARFKGTCLAVPNGFYKPRPADVLTPQQLCSWHRGYRCRVEIGPTYRADLWAACEARWPQTLHALAKAAYCSKSAARRVAHDYALTSRIAAA